MKSELVTVDEYLLSVPDNRRGALNQLRSLCIKHLPDHEENMRYKMPSYVRNDQVQAAFASQKQHIVVYFLIHEVMLKNQDRLNGLNHGKGAIRFTHLNKIQFDTIEFLLKETAKSDQTIC